ncbi:EamA domain-containing membrane protein RarD [Pseudooceanicola antarcticus]|uniref:EamA domain-containing membrane protein RarD n=1 Tax=Pseudooceanicola antarcticus TaxID=1247613 RepID=A0A285J6A5_9RHOB|nr:DMT family transporter [Pseudooceanicola antarcticus]PJE26946.1 EamA/RhaT family transporter [Pseudooceanicola antarcticus]SNY55859.1 EamA domain-containing membrane protein RarD [Pseudooceanicola antarcticus]
MRLLLLTGLAMLAFAANSLLNRLALAEAAIGPASFAAIRVGSGALVLLSLLCLRQGRWPDLPRPEPWSVLGLAAYMLGFSFAYVSMDAGLGALVLFGGVQLTMFLGAVIEGDRPAPRRWLGMALSMAGLAVLSLPGGELHIAPFALASMGLAALGWGIYSLRGRRAGDPLAATAWNFLYCLPLMLVVLPLWPDGTPASWAGIGLAVLSGAVTSGLGYALWYALLPALGASRGALAQLSVPVLALALAALLLGEAIGGLAVVSAAMILGGIALGLTGGTGRRG